MYYRAKKGRGGCTCNFYLHTLFTYILITELLHRETKIDIQLEIMSSLDLCLKKGLEDCLHRVIAPTLNFSIRTLNFDVIFGFFFFFWTLLP